MIRYRIANIGLLLFWTLAGACSSDDGDGSDRDQGGAGLASVAGGAGEAGADGQSDGGTDSAGGTEENAGTTAEGGDAGGPVSPSSGGSLPIAGGGSAGEYQGLGGASRGGAETSGGNAGQDPGRGGASPGGSAFGGAFDRGGSPAMGGATGGNVDPGNPVLWTQGCGTKVQPTTSAGDGRTIEVAGPRDSYQSYQVVVRGDQGVLNDVRFSWTDLTNGDSGDVIEASQIELFRQWFVDFEGTDTVRGEPTVVGSRPVPESSPTSDTRVPDPLIPLINPYEGGDLGQPFQVSTNQNQPIWVDVHIPKGISAGTYAGTITMTSSQGEDTVPISVQVWDLDLPDMGSVQTMYQFSIDPLSRYHSGTAESPDDYWLSWSERSRLIVKRYEQLAHSHRIDTKQQFVRLAAEGCEPPASWSTFDQSIQSYMDGSYWDDGVPSTILQVALSPGHTDEYTMGAGCSEEQYKALASAWADHLKEQGWFDRAIVFVLDEPSDEEYSLIIREAGWMIEADPDWKSKILATIQPRSNNTAQLNPALGIYCVNPPFYVYADSPDSGLDFSYYGRDTEYSWQQLFDEGIALWFYDSNSNTPPYPTFATNALDGLEPTMLMWGSWYEHATGSLFWTINYWDVEDPWGPSYETWRKTGDGVLLYPGHHDGLDAPLGSPPEVELDGPIPSYRLKMIRLGLQDWALFSLAERLGLQELARAEVSRAYAQLGCNWIDCDAPLGDFLWNTDESIMNDVRRNVATAVIDASP